MIFTKLDIKNKILAHCWAGIACIVEEETESFVEILISSCCEDDCFWIIPK